MDDLTNCAGNSGPKHYITHKHVKYPIPRFTLEFLSQFVKAHFDVKKKVLEDNREAYGEEKFQTNLDNLILMAEQGKLDFKSALGVAFVKSNVGMVEMMKLLIPDIDMITLTEIASHHSDELKTILQLNMRESFPSPKNAPKKKMTVLPKGNRHSRRAQMAQ